MKNFTFRQYRRSPKQDSEKSGAGGGDSKDKDAAYLKRREQVRRAQRTHRERKENYIKSLENEVLQLRTSEAKIFQENLSLQGEIGRLRRVLEQHGIPYSDGNQDLFLTQPINSPSSAPLSSSSISILENPHHQQQLHILSPSGSGSGGGSAQFYLTESEESPPANDRELRGKRSFFRRRGRSESQSQSNDESSGSGHAPATRAGDISAIAQSASNLNLRDMNQTDLGMEFVLTLEAPCLHHTQGDPNDPNAPTGHALTASAPLLFQSPTQAVNTTTTSNLSHQQHQHWATPHLGLEKLLSLSSNFELSDEITPVQAWHQIRSHPDFQNVGVGELRRLTEDMRKHVKCYGFGAVVDVEVFEGLVGSVFPAWGLVVGLAS